MNIVEALHWLDSHIDHESTSVGVAAGAIEGLSLAPMADLMALLGDPQLAVPVIHVTGTNGKGSTAMLISSLLTASGLSVGLYTSPHVERLNERIRRDAQPISDEDLAEVLSGVAAVEDLLLKRESDPLWVGWRPLEDELAFVEKHLGGDVLHIELANQVSFLNRAALLKLFDGMPRGSQVLLDARNTDYIDPDVLDLIRDFRDHKAPARGVEVAIPLGFTQSLDALAPHGEQRQVGAAAEFLQVLDVGRGADGALVVRDAASLQQGATAVTGFARRAGVEGDRVLGGHLAQFGGQGRVGGAVARTRAGACHFALRGIGGRFVRKRDLAVGADDAVHGLGLDVGEPHQAQGSGP